MILVIDTSALVKKYLAEEESQNLFSLLAETKYLLTSALTELEILATLEQAKKMKRLDSPGYRRAFTLAERDFKEEVITVVEINKPILQLAKKLVTHRRLRAPDSIQLATALESDRLSAGIVPFVCCDRYLLEVAKLEGLKTFDLTN